MQPDISKTNKPVPIAQEDGWLLFSSGDYPSPHNGDMWQNWVLATKKIGKSVIALEQDMNRPQFFFFANTIGSHLIHTQMQMGENSEAGIRAMRDEIKQWISV